MALVATTSTASPLGSATAEYRQMPREYRLDGVIEAVNRSTIAAQTQGQVKAILVDIDQRVEQGDVVVRLKDTEQRARLLQAEADLQAASAQLRDARDTHQRRQELFKKKLVSQADMDSAATTLAAARAARDAAQAAREQAREQLAYTRVRAPYSGIVTARQIQVGEIATPGQPLISGISLDRLRVNVDVPQSLIPALRNNRQAQIELPDGRRIDSDRITIFPVAQQPSNSFRVRVELPSGTDGLYPGMLVKSAFVVGDERQLAIPQQAVVYRSEVTGVYVIGDDQRIRLRHIRLGRANADGSAVVLSGLLEGERVALDPIAAGTRLKGQAEPDRG